MPLKREAASDPLLKSHEREIREERNGGESRESESAGQQPLDRKQGSGSQGREQEQGILYLVSCVLLSSAEKDDEEAYKYQ